ncbi:hypothetical protein [Helicobacter sp.]|uniref:hypothetical protein n=1 Tax=Helicobacter sp. TaxID=218 RepID=UPI0025BB38A5|nr:hypothetical protein [Helicobacter sp.]MCI5968835.1 hypothetical protein [Helicobacter sp.]MDY2585020.1 hypothetical protein [Helicobacter sp.]
MESKTLGKKEYSKLARRDFFTPYLLGLSFLPLLLAFLLFCGILIWRKFVCGIV